MNHTRVNIKSTLHVLNIETWGRASTRRNIATRLIQPLTRSPTRSPPPAGSRDDQPLGRARHQDGEGHRDRREPAPAKHRRRWPPALTGVLKVEDRRSEHEAALGKILGLICWGEISGLLIDIRKFTMSGELFEISDPL